MEHCLLAYLRCIIATLLLLNPSAAEVDPDRIATEDYQNHQILDVSEDGQNLCSHAGTDCVVNLLQTSIMLKPTPLQPKANITAIQAIQSSSYFASRTLSLESYSSTFYMNVTFLIMSSVGLLTFMLSAPVTNSPRNTPTAHSPQDHERDAVKPETQSPSQPQTNMSKCPNLAALDGLRIIFITMIIKSHFDFDADSKTSKAGNGGMQFFMILCGFIRVVTSKEPDPTTRVGQSFRHHVARLITRFCPAYYLALAWTIMQERENVSMLVPMQASFATGLIPSASAGGAIIGRSCSHAKDIVACWTFFGHGWFVADIFVLIMMFPVFDKIPQIVQKCWARVMLMVIFAILPEYLLYGRNWDYHFVGLRAFQVLAGMMAGHIAKQLRDWASQRSGWHYLLDFAFALVMFKGFVADCPTAPEAIQQLGRFWWGEAMLGLVWCLLMVSNYFGTMTGSFGILNSICEHCHVAALAVYSFGAYIYQFNVYTTLAALFPVFMERRSSTYVTVALCWVVGVASEKLVEKPLRGWVEARMKGSGKA